MSALIGISAALAELKACHTVVFLLFSAPKLSVGSSASALRQLKLWNLLQETLHLCEATSVHDMDV
jgi:hypothetical protein